MSELPSIPIQELPGDLGDDVLLDVREDDEWEAGHAPNALHIPMGELPERIGELDLDQTHYVICRSGGRSARVTAWMVQNGADAINVEGGMGAYARDGRPMESDSGRPEVI